MFRTVQSVANGGARAHASVSLLHAHLYTQKQSSVCNAWRHIALTACLHVYREFDVASDPRLRSLAWALARRPAALPPRAVCIGGPRVRGWCRCAAGANGLSAGCTATAPRNDATPLAVLFLSLPDRAAAGCAPRDPESSLECRERTFSPLLHAVAQFRTITI